MSNLFMLVFVYEGCEGVMIGLLENKSNEVTGVNLGPIIFFLKQMFIF